MPFYWLLIPLLCAAQEGGSSDLPPLLDERSCLRPGERLVYRRSDGGSAEIRLVAAGEGEIRVVRRDLPAGGTTRGSHAIVNVAAPFSLHHAGGVSIDGEYEGWQETEAGDGEAPWRLCWRRSGPGTPDGGVLELKKVPSTETQLLLALRAVRWELGSEFVLAVIWDLGDSNRDLAEKSAEGVLRTHIRCTGRETIETAQGNTPCWRVVVEAQARAGVRRAVYWVCAAPPHAVVRLEEADGGILDLIERWSPPPRTEGNPTSGGRPPDEKDGTP